jgi:hypothetical protein
MPHEKVGLPASFAGQFFRHDAGSGSEETPTLESIDEELAILEKQTAEKNEQRKALETAAEQAAKAEAEKAAKQAVIAELQKAAAEAAKKLADAQAKLAELSQ